MVSELELELEPAHLRLFPHTPRARCMLPLLPTFELGTIGCYRHLLLRRCDLIMLSGFPCIHLPFSCNQRMLCPARWLIKSVLLGRSVSIYSSHLLFFCLRG